MATGITLLVILDVLNVDAIVTHGWPAAKAAKEATGAIPIVFAVATDPVKFPMAQPVDMGTRLASSMLPINR